jgi:hypothetical protein
VKAISAVATAGLGAAAFVALRVALPDVAALDALGSTQPKAVVEIGFTFAALAFGAVLGLLAGLSPSRWLVAGGSLALAVPAWLGVAASSVRNTLGSIKSGDALAASILLSPVWLVMAGGCLAAALVGSLVAGLGLALVSRALDRFPALAWGIALSAWPAAVTGAGWSVSVTPPDPVEAVAVVAPPSPPQTPACGAVPFAAAFADTPMRGPWRSLPQDHFVEYRVLGRGEWTSEDLARAAAGVDSQGLECMSGGSTVRLRVVPADRLRVKLRLDARRPAGQDRRNFKMMLESQLRSAFDGAMQVTDQGTFATSVTAAWSMIPPGAVHGGFTCVAEDADAGLVCEGDRIEVRTFGVAPAFAGVELMRP